MTVHQAKNREFERVLILWPAMIVGDAEAQRRLLYNASWPTPGRGRKQSGMRLREVLDLRWERVDLEDGRIHLAPQDTKTKEGRVVFMTRRVLDAVGKLPRPKTGMGPVFISPRTGKGWKDIRKVFKRACSKAGLEGVWFHDLRRSFVTNARRRGIPESVVMRMSGHKTRAVFDRYNVVSEDDLRAAVRTLESTTSKNGQSSLLAPKSENPAGGLSDGESG